MPLNSQTELAGARVVVMGLGRFGGGVGVTRFLLQQGADVLVTDLEPAERLQNSLAQLADLPVEYRLGEHNVSDFTTADLIVVNPAVKPHDNRFLRAAEAADIPLTSEIRLLISRLPSRLRTIGVTGSAGKSTSVAMIGHAMERLGQRVFVGGNIGGSLLSHLDQIGNNDWVVLELSSFMLKGTQQDQWSPHVALVTNFAPNHLDWHGDLEDYRSAKQAMLDFQQPDVDYTIFGPDISDQFTPRGKVITREWSDPDIASQLSLLVPGRHNRMNAMLAADAVSIATGCDWHAAAGALDDFAGLPHRLQLVAERREVQYFNDSKSTTPDAALLAIEAFPRARVHAILGGYDKGSDLAELAKRAADHCRAVYTVGATGETIAQLIEQHQQQQAEQFGTLDRGLACGGAVGWDSAGAELIRCETLDNAVKQSATRVREGDVVLLSPGCASWDQYENFEQRGNAFVAAVLNYTGEGAAPPKV